MSATLHKDEARAASRARGVQSFVKLAELVQRYLGCEAAVLSVDDPLGALRRTRAPVTDARRASAAFRPGHETFEMDLDALTNPLVAGRMGMRFYAGLPLRDSGGRAIGMLAAMDQHERTLACEELETLKQLAGMASDLYEMQRLGHAA